MFDRIQLSNTKEDTFLLISTIFEDNIKIKRQVHRIILVFVKRQKLMPLASMPKGKELKQMQTRIIV